MKPLLHFLLLGGLLFGGKQLLPEAGPARAPVRIAAADVAALRAQWPQERQFQAALERHIRDEVLLQEALRLGFDAGDPVARQRMLANLRFAYPHSTLSDEALLRQARVLGMARRDVVVRRRLVQLMEQRLAAGAGPTAAQLAQALAEHAGGVGESPRFAFRQLFFTDAQAAASALAQLRRGLAVAGEPFLLGPEFRGLSAQQVGRRFGGGFATALTLAPQGEWSGPYRSAYGLHLVRIDERVPAPVEYAAVRAPLAYALAQEQQQRRVLEETARLRASTPVELP